MNFRQLEVLVSVIRHGSFSRAAEELFLTQPTVSTHIGALEEELGVQLVSRGHKSATPTQAGAVLYEYANALLRMRDNVYNSMKRCPELLNSMLELAASTVPAAYLLPPLIAAFCKTYPGVRFSVRESNSQKVLACVLSGEVELGFAGTELRSEKCRFDEVAADRLVIVAPRCAPYTEYAGGEISPAVLQSAPFVLRASGSATQKEADAFLINVGIAPQSLHAAAYMDGIESVKQAVRSGLGVAILSEIAVRDMEARGEVLVFRNENPFLHRKLYCLCRSDRALSPSAELFLHFVKSRAAALG